MKSELTPEFLERFRNLPEWVKQTARKNYRLWKQNPCHPSVEFNVSRLKRYDLFARGSMLLAICYAQNVTRFEKIDRLS
jgi:hypothetical protein